MALFFLEVLIIFTISSFNKSDCLDFIANGEWPQFTQPQSTGLLGLEAMLESYHNLQRKPKTVSEFKICISVNWVCFTGENYYKNLKTSKVQILGFRFFKFLKTRF